MSCGVIWCHVVCTQMLSTRTPPGFLGAQAGSTRPGGNFSGPQYVSLLQYVEGDLSVGEDCRARYYFDDWIIATASFIHYRLRAEQSKVPSTTISQLQALLRAALDAEQALVGQEHGPVMH